MSRPFKLLGHALRVIPPAPRIEFCSRNHGAARAALANTLGFIPARLRENTRACSGPITRACPRSPSPSSGDARFADLQASEGARERFRLSRQLVDHIARPLSRKQRHGVHGPACAPRSTESGCHGEPSSSSAKQNAQFPRVSERGAVDFAGTAAPNVANHQLESAPNARCSHGCPAPARSYRNSCRSYVSDRTVDDQRPGRRGIVVASRPCMLNSSVQAASTAKPTRPADTRVGSRPSPH